MPKYLILFLLLFSVGCNATRTPPKTYTAICNTPGGPAVVKGADIAISADNGVAQVTGERGTFFTHSINCLFVEE